MLQLSLETPDRVAQLDKLLRVNLTERTIEIETVPDESDSIYQIVPIFNTVVAAAQ